jgi:hypothetical protein
VHLNGEVEALGLHGVEERTGPVQVEELLGDA